VIVLFVIVSCAPSPIFKLKPIAEETKWIYGQEFVKSYNDSIEISIAFEKYSENLLSAEYILKGGNSNIILCERGVRTFDSHSRNILDIAVVPVLKELIQFASKAQRKI
jgi:hypothetical protein